VTLRLGHIRWDARPPRRRREPRTHGFRERGACQRNSCLSWRSQRWCSPGSSRSESWLGSGVQDPQQGSLGSPAVSVETVWEPQRIRPRSARIFRSPTSCGRNDAIAATAHQVGAWAPTPSELHFVRDHARVAADAHKRDDTEHAEWLWSHSNRYGQYRSTPIPTERTPCSRRNGASSSRTSCN
jgi:hypothetical protein